MIAQKFLTKPNTSKWKKDFFQQQVHIEQLNLPQKVYTKLIMWNKQSLKSLKNIQEKHLLTDKVSRAGPVTAKIKQEYNQVVKKVQEYKSKIISDFDQIQRKFLYKLTERISIPISRRKEEVRQVEQHQKEHPEDFFFSLGEMFAINGQSGTGKTSLLLHMCFNVQLPPVLGGLESGVIFVDCDGGFSFERVLKLANSFCKTLAETNRYNSERYSVREVLNHIHLMRVSDKEQWDEFFDQLEQFLQVHPNIKLIAFDHFTFISRSTSFVKHYQKKNLIENALKRLKQLSYDKNICIILTNVLGSKMDKTTEAIYQQPIYGNIISLYVHHSLQLERHGESMDLVRAIPSTGLPKLLLPTGYLLFSIQENIMERYTKQEEMAALLFENEEDQNEIKKDGYINPMFKLRFPEYFPDKQKE